MSQFFKGPGYEEDEDDFDDDYEDLNSTDYMGLDDD